MLFLSDIWRKVSTFVGQFIGMRKFITTIVAILGTLAATAAQPKLVVNIVVGGMKASDLDRYEVNFAEGGFKLLKEGGALFAECYTDFVPSCSEMALATIATGSLPSMHGISSTRWYDRTSGNTIIELCRTPKGLPTVEHFSAPTLSQTLTATDSSTRVVTVAHNINSAMVLAGSSGECYWIDELGNWATADCYSTTLPEWVVKHNESCINRSLILGTWFGKLPKTKYLNRRVTDIQIYDIYAKAKSLFAKKVTDKWVTELKSTPVGNNALFTFATKMVDNMLADSQKSGCKMLNICLDTPRIIAEKYGPDSVEYEDMLYYLDESIANFLAHISTKYPNKNDYLVVLTSDHGNGNHNFEQIGPHNSFNTRQAAVILNAFLSAQFGQGSWVLSFEKGAIYLNRDLIYSKRLSVSDIQNEAATFAMQFRGMANTATATAMLGGVMSSSTSRLMQNSFYPRRSGDILYCLQPNYYELIEDNISISGSPYNYDRHIPLIFYGAGLRGRVIDRKMESSSIAVTTAYLLGITRPDCADGQLLYELR